MTAYRLEITFNADDDSEARRIARTMIADANVTHGALRHGDPSPEAVLSKPRSGGGGYVVAL